MVKLKLSFIFVTLVTFLLYQRTLLPGVGFWDTGEFQTIAYTLNIGHPPGYPTYIVLGGLFSHLLPVGSVAWRMNIMSALMSSVACGVVMLLIFNLTKDYFASIFGSLILGFCKVVWDVSIRAEVFSMHFLFTALFLYLLSEILLKKRDKLMLPAAFIVGVSMGNHLLSIFFIPLIFLTIFFRYGARRGLLKRSFFAGMAIILGSLVYILLPILSIVKQPLTIDYSLANVDGFIRHVTGRDFAGAMGGWIRGGFQSTIVYYLGYLREFLPVILLVFMVVGMVMLWRRSWRINTILTLLVLMTLGFSLRYQNAILERYFIPSFLVFGVWVGVGIDSLFRLVSIVGIKKLRWVLGIVVLVFMMGEVASEIRLNYKKVDRSKDFGAEEFAKEVLEGIGPNGVVFSWWSYSTPLWYFQLAEGVRKDVGIVNVGSNKWEGMGKDLVFERPVYFIENVILRDPSLRLIKSGNIYKLEKVYFGL